MLDDVLATNNFHISRLRQILKYHRPCNFHPFRIIIQNTIALDTICVAHKYASKCLFIQNLLFGFINVRILLRDEDTKIRQVRLRFRTNFKRSLVRMRSACNTIRYKYRSVNGFSPPLLLNLHVVNPRARSLRQRLIHLLSHLFYCGRYGTVV